MRVLVIVQRTRSPSSTESYQVGVDTRVAIADGYPVENAIASDLQKRTYY